MKWASFKWYHVVNWVTKKSIKALRWASFPWSLPWNLYNNHCKKGDETITVSHVVVRTIMFAGVLSNLVTIRLLSWWWFQNYFDGNAFGLAVWEWTLLGLGIGRLFFGVFFLLMEYFGLDKERFTITFASIFGTQCHEGDARERNAMRLSLTLLTAQAFYFFAAFVITPGENIVCGVCEEDSNITLKDDAGLCCRIVRVKVGVFSTAFLSAMGGSLATGYGITKILLSGAVSAHQMHMLSSRDLLSGIALPLLHSEVPAGEE
mmetsp:Transcript_65332/g.120386  ORF Transcript_65332/g.120386 Transcript_65332/m.120386 type:complete len:262 (-) Transcript_65332:42-827(-)